ncbi:MULTISPECIES: hypothetical protein [Sphingobacterium]|uniref:hypothetical protein n=1 Tax=Sphingobacterium TaxID=28453 RepID=UPI001048562D|nr:MULTISPECIES: hypothetical protein [Sphingobacterium]MCW2259598.1 hypothetical protein [Sphingobacterium kitahiroshimense]TCR13959.1 hypothetical protein EDF67_10162 [Sphingobacterium sp. JUb78]
MNWFKLTGPNPSNPAHYILVVSVPICPAPPQKLCAIYAMNDGNNQPVISDELKNEIINALQNEINTTNVLLEAR